MPHQCPSGPCILTNVKPGNLFQEPTRIASDGAARQLCASRRHLDCRFAATCVCHPVHPPQMHIFIILEPMWKSCAHCATTVTQHSFHSHLFVQSCVRHKQVCVDRSGRQTFGWQHPLLFSALSAHLVSVLSHQSTATRQAACLSPHMMRMISIEICSLPCMCNELVSLHQEKESRNERHAKGTRRLGNNYL